MIDVNYKDDQFPNFFNKPPTRLEPLQLYMCIKKYINNKKILIDKNLIKGIIGEYKIYLDMINIISQCPQSINFIDKSNHK